ncbi:MAG: NAD-dependent epimerase/dehydratase family protein [Chthoniobacterales bacterium]|nr:NAD-dependent epimerase/dehydratase family protein [Chthoniobacterales bacterium]
MNILVTGGAGFIGSHVAEFHLGRGDSVSVVDDLTTGSEANVAIFRDNARYRFAQADILTWPDLDKEVAAADRIYHMAAVVGMFRVLKEPVRVTEVNVCGTERLLRAAARAGHKPQTVIASSSSVYGHCQTTELREDAELVFVPHKGGLTGYALGKLMNEVQARAYRRQHELPVVIARLFNAVGPRQTGNYGFVLPRFVKQALAGKPLTVFGDGTQTRSFCDVRDTVAALDMLAGNPADWGEPVNVGNTREISILDLAEMVIERAGSSSKIEFIPFDRAYGEHFEHITQRRPVEEKLESLTGFHPKWSLEKTVDDLIARNRNQPASEERLS